MKIILLSGFLGAGKTSVLLQLAKYLVRQGDAKAAKTKVAILENEIGEVSVDSAAVSGGLDAGSFELRELFSGCVCCSLTGEMIATVLELQETLDPEWLIVEATGLAVPDSVATQLRSGLSDLEGLVTAVLVDAARFLVLEIVSPLVGKQAASADILLVNKVDIASSEVKTQVLAKLSQLNPSAEVLELVATEAIADAVFEKVVSSVR